MATAAVMVGGSALASIGGSYLAGKGSKKAAKIQAGAADRSAALQAETTRESMAMQQQRFEDIKGSLSPYMQAGQAPMQRQQALSGALGPEAQQQAYQSYQESPGVAFQREQGMKGINQAMSASGGLGGGSRLKAMSEFNQNLAQQDFANQYNRLGALTGVGLSATQALGGVSQAATAGQAQTMQAGAAGQSQAMQASGAAQAQGVAGKYGAMSSGLSQLAGIGMMGAMGGFGGGSSAPNVQGMVGQPISAYGVNY